MTPVSFTLVEMKEKYEAEKQKNKALEDVKIKHKQNMERMTKIVGDYKSELDKARKELKDAKGKKVKVTLMEAQLTVLQETPGWWLVEALAIV